MEHRKIQQAAGNRQLAAGREYISDFGFRIADFKKGENGGSTVGAAFSRDLAVSTNFLIF